MIQASLPNVVNPEETTYYSIEKGVFSPTNLAEMSIPEESIKPLKTDPAINNIMKFHVRSNLTLGAPLMVSTSDTYKRLTAKSSASTMLLGYAKRKSSHIPIITPPFTPTSHAPSPIQPITPVAQYSSDPHSPSYEECFTVTDSDHLFDFNFSSPVCSSSYREKKYRAAVKIQKTFRSWVVRLKYRNEEQKRINTFYTVCRECINVEEINFRFMKEECPNSYEYVYMINERLLLRIKNQFIQTDDESEKEELFKFFFKICNSSDEDDFISHRQSELLFFNFTGIKVSSRKLHKKFHEIDQNYRNKLKCDELFNLYSNLNKENKSLIDILSYTARKCIPSKNRICKVFVDHFIKMRIESFSLMTNGGRYLICNSGKLSCSKCHSFIGTSLIQLIKHRRLCNS